MSTKVSILSELTSTIAKKEKREMGILVQNGSAVKAVFRSKETGKTGVIGSVINDIKSSGHLCDAANRPVRDG
jgi:hypothetical protein